MNKYSMVISSENRELDLMILLSGARLMDWPLQMRCPDKRHVAITLFDVHCNYYSSIQIYKEAIVINKY